jgi:transposase
VIDPTRSGQPVEQLLGRDWSGTQVHDGWSVYDRFTRAAHQQCLAHLQRRREELVETAVRGAVCSARIDRPRLRLAARVAWTSTRQQSVAERGLVLACELERLASGRFTHEPNRRLAGHLLRHAMHWFWFLIDPTIDATDYRGEQTMRPAAVNRKVWGGNCTWQGARDKVFWLR